MKFTAEIKVKEPELYDAIKQEIFDEERSKTEITKNKEETIIKVEAKDITALKAHLNSTIKIITVWENLKKIK